MRTREAAAAITAMSAGDTAASAQHLTALTHQKAIAALLTVAATTARFASQETGIPTGELLAVIGARP